MICLACSVRKHAMMSFVLPLSRTLLPGAQFQQSRKRNVCTETLRRSSRVMVKASASQPASPSGISQGPNWSKLSSEGKRAIHAALKANRSLRDVAQEDPTNPFLWHAAVMHEIKEKRQISEAHRLLDIALDAVPEGRRAALYIVRGQLQKGTDAIESFRQGLNDDRTHSLTYVCFALELSRNGDPEAARNMFAKGVENVSLHGRCRILRAWAGFEYAQKNRAASRDLWRQLTELRPTDVLAWRRFLDAEKVLNPNLEDVMSCFRKALAVHPSKSEFRVGMSLLIEKKDGPGAARAFLDDPCFHDDHAVLRHLALLEVREGNLERARRIFRRAVDLEVSSVGSDNASNHENKRAPDGSECRLSSSSETESRTQRYPATNFRRSRSFSRETFDQPKGKTLHSWVLTEMKLGNLEEARDLLKEAQRSVPDDPAMWRALAELESRSRNFHAARNAFQRAVAGDDGDSRLWLAWGKTEAIAGNLARAEELVQTAIAKHKQGLTAVDRHFGVGDVDHHFADSDHSKHDDPELSSVYVSRRAPFPKHVLADAQRELSSIAVQNGKPEKAIELLEAAVATDPNYVQAWRQLSELVRKLHGIDGVRKIFMRAINVSVPRHHPKLYHWWALEERTAGSEQEVRDLFRRSTKADPTYMSAWLSWALWEKAQNQIDSACEVLKKAAAVAERLSLRTPFIFQAWARFEELERGNVEESRRIFEKAHRIAPGSGLLLQAWACLEERAGQFDKARLLLNKATLAEPKHGFIWQSWGQLEARRRKYDEAARLFAVGMKVDPRNAGIPAAWGLIEGRDMGNLERGRELFEQSTRIDPMHATTWHSWGSLEMMHKNFARARELYLKAASLDPSDYISWHALGALEAERGISLTLPVEHFQRALSLNPTRAICYQSLALFIERSRQDLDKARELYSAGIKACGNKESAILYQSWASLEQRQGDLNRARELLQIGLSLDRQRVESWLVLALLEKSCGNRKIAAQLLSGGVQAVSPARDVTAIYTAWGAMESEMGNFVEARKLFNRGLRINPNHEACWRSYARLEETNGNMAKADQLRQLAKGAIDPGVIAFSSTVDFDSPEFSL